MMRSRRLLALGLLALSSACTENAAGPLSPGGRGIMLRPHYGVAAGSNFEFRPINQIRLTARHAESNALLDSLTIDVDPDASSWTITFEVAPTEPNQRVLVTAELIHNSSSGQVVELSGTTAVFELSTDAPIAQDINVYPGPLANLQVSALEITDIPAGMAEGDAAQLRAQAISGGTDVRVFWGSLNPDIVAIDSAGNVRALLPGTARIVAQAGRAEAFADITVNARPARIELSPGSIALNFIGAESTIGAQVFDTRGAVLSTARINWAVVDSQVVRHLGNGRFRAIGFGATEIQATVAGVAGVSASATATVAQTISVVRVTPAAAVLQSRGQTVQLVAVVEDAGGTAIPNAAVTWSSSDPAVATVDATGQVTAVENGLAVITATSGDASASADVRVSRLPHTITIVQGNAQSGDAGEALGVSPAVQVLDASRTPVVGIEVQFAVTAGDGSIEQSSVATNANGIADAGRWTLGSAGLNTLKATVNGLDPVTFTATANAVVTGPGSITIHSGNHQTAQVGDTLSGIAVRVVDALGDPVAVDVVFAVASGGGSIIGGVAHTDTAGVATLHGWVLGTTPGSNTLTASVEGLEPVTFTATALARGPHTIEIIDGDGQTANAGTAVPVAPAVRVTDEFGNTLSGVAVTFTAVSGGGSVTGAVDSTNAEGVAKVGSWILGSASGLNLLDAEVAGLPPVTFTATAVSSSPGIFLALGEGHTNVGVTFTAPLYVRLNEPAPAGGVLVTVVSSNPGKLHVPAPGTVLIPGGETESIIEIEGVEAGSVTLTASATGYAPAELLVSVSLRLISLPVTLNVPYGQTTSLPVQLAEPAPSGGVAITLVSSDETIVGIVTPTITIPAGSVLGSATVRGALPGPVTVTASAPGYIGAMSSVVSRANLDFIESSEVINPSFPGTVTLRLQSSGSPIAAPAGGVSIAIHAADPACVAVPASATIADGLTQTTLPVSYGGNATLPCNTHVHATAVNILSDSLTVQVTPTPTITTAARDIGSGLQRSTTLSLSANNHGGATIKLVSADPAKLLLAPNSSTVGSDTLLLFIPNNASSANFVLQSVGDTGVVAVHASAPGFTPAVTNHTIEPSAIDVVSFGGILTTVSPDDVFRVRVGLPSSAGGSLRELQSVRAGGPPLTVTIQSDSPSVALVVSSGGEGPSATTTIQPEETTTPASVASGGVAMRPVMSGTTFVRATAPGVISTAAATHRLDVTAATLSLTDQTVGAGLQRRQTVSLSAGAHGGITVRVTSTNPSALLVASSADSVGSAFIDVAVPDGTTAFNFYTNALEGASGTVVVSAKADGFVADSAGIDIAAPGLDIGGLFTEFTTASAPDAFSVRIGLPLSGGLTELQTARPGGAGYSINVTSSAPDVAELLSASDTAGTIVLRIEPGRSTTGGTLSSGGAALRPLAAGSTTVTASAAGTVATASASSTITVTASTISLFTSTTGAGLQRSQSVALSGSNHGGVTVRVTSTDTTRLLLAPNSISAGVKSIDLEIADGQTSVSFFAQALDSVTGPVSIEASAPGFTSATDIINIVQPAADITGLSTSRNTLDINDLFNVRIGIASGSSFVYEEQERRFGASPLPVSVTSSTTAGQIVTSTTSGGIGMTSIGANASRSPSNLALGGVAFRPFTTGATVVSARIPGFRVLTNSDVTVNVTAPAITLNSITLGAGLQSFVSGSLNAPNHGGTTVTISTSNASVAQVSANASTTGQASVDLFVPDGTASFAFFVQGMDGAAATVAIRASAPGFTDANATATVVQPAIDISGLPTTLSSSAPDIFQVRVGVADANLNGLTSTQQRRAGATPLVVTVVSSDAAVARLATATTNGDSIILNIVPTTFTTPGTLSGGGVQIEPLAPGSTTVSATIPGFLQTSNATRTVTIPGGAN